MATKKISRQPFRSAKTEVGKLPRKVHPQVAFTDTEFLLRKELRPVRLMLELMKPELALREFNIESTIVFFGSARIPEPRIAKAELLAAQQKLQKHPHSQSLLHEVKIAERVVAKSQYYTEARKLAKIISTACQKGKKRQFVIITGGGPGIMEAANRGAHDARGKSIALNIILPQEQDPNIYIPDELSFQFHYFAMRKMHFLIRARALVIFPGGFGTLDELFEALTLMQTKKIKLLPVVLFGKEYWSNVLNFQYMVDEGMISKEDLKLFEYVETAEEAWHAILRHYHLTPEGLLA